jgi:hypothetical protein
MEQDNAANLLGQALGTPISGWGKYRPDIKLPGPGWKQFRATHGLKIKNGSP